MECGIMKSENRTVRMTTLLAGLFAICSGLAIGNLYGLSHYSYRLQMGSDFLRPAEDS